MWGAVHVWRMTHSFGCQRGIWGIYFCRDARLREILGKFQIAWIPRIELICALRCAGRDWSWLLRNGRIVSPNSIWPGQTCKNHWIMRSKQLRRRVPSLLWSESWMKYNCWHFSNEIFHLQPSEPLRIIGFIGSGQGNSYQLSMLEFN